MTDIVLDELGERWSVERGDPAYPIVQQLKKLEMPEDYIVLPLSYLLRGYGEAYELIDTIKLDSEHAFRLWDSIMGLYTGREEDAIGEKEGNG